MDFIFHIMLRILNLYSFAILIYVLMSWIPNARGTQFGQLLGTICEPYLDFFRRFIPPLGMIDISPIVALIVLQFAGRGLGYLAMWF